MKHAARSMMWVVGLTGAMTAAASAGAPAACVCTGDLNGSGNVNAADLALLLGAWNTPGQDLNGDNTTNAADLALLLGAWGKCGFEFNPPAKNAEAEQIALEMLGPGGALLPTQELYERVDRDLGLIRAFEPALANQGHSMAWAPSQLIVALFLAQPHDGYACLNEHYQVVKEDVMFEFGGVEFRLITLPGNINVEALAQDYMTQPEVDFAEPNGLFGGQNFWTPTDLGGGVWRWNVDDGFQDCFDGCDCHNFYVFETDGRGNVTLISFEQVGSSFCGF